MADGESNLLEWFVVSLSFMLAFPADDVAPSPVCNELLVGEDIFAITSERSDDGFFCSAPFFLLKFPSQQFGRLSPAWPSFLICSAS